MLPGTIAPYLLLMVCNIIPYNFNFITVRLNILWELLL